MAQNLLCNIASLAAHTYGSHLMWQANEVSKKRGCSGSQKGLLNILCKALYPITALHSMVLKDSDEQRFPQRGRGVQLVFSFVWRNKGLGLKKKKKAHKILDIFKWFYWWLVLRGSKIGQIGDSEKCTWIDLWDWPEYMYVFMSHLSAYQETSTEESLKLIILYLK